MRLHTALHLLAVLVISVAIGIWLEAQLAEPVVFGGSVCETTDGIRACFGYPPAGIAIIFIGVAVASWPVEWYFRQ